MRNTCRCKHVFQKHIKFLCELILQINFQLVLANGCYKTKSLGSCPWTKHHLQSSYHLTAFWDGNLISLLVGVTTSHTNRVLIMEVRAQQDVPSWECHRQEFHVVPKGLPGFSWSHQRHRSSGSRVKFCPAELRFCCGN